MFRTLIILIISIFTFSINANAKVDFSGKNITWVVPEGAGGPNYANM